MKIAMKIEKSVYSNSATIRVRFVHVDSTNMAISADFCQHGRVDSIWSNRYSTKWMDSVSVYGHSYLGKNTQWEEFGYKLVVSSHDVELDDANETVKKLTNLTKKVDKYDVSERKIECISEFVYAVAQSAKIDYLLFPKNDGSEFGYDSIAVNAKGLQRLQEFCKMPIVETIAVETTVE